MARATPAECVTQTASADPEARRPRATRPSAGRRPAVNEKTPLIPLSISAGRAGPARARAPSPGLVEVVRREVEDRRHHRRVLGARSVAGSIGIGPVGVGADRPAGRRARGSTGRGPGARRIGWIVLVLGRMRRTRRARAAGRRRRTGGPAAGAGSSSPTIAPIRGPQIPARADDDVGRDLAAGR